MDRTSFTKDPQARLDFSVDWDLWLKPDETIAESTWDVPDGITLDDEGHVDRSTTVWLTGGTARATYTVTNTITTSAGRVDQRSLYVVCQDR